MDSVFRNNINTAEVPSYWLLNAVASYDVNTHFTLRLNGTNLADERYIDRDRRRSLHSRTWPAGHGHGDGEAIEAGRC